MKKSTLYGIKLSKNTYKSDKKKDDVKLTCKMVADTFNKMSLNSHEDQEACAKWIRSEQQKILDMTKE